MISGKATAEGTARFRKRFEGEGEGSGQFRRLGELWLSSIGLGTYLGEADEEGDRGYEEAVIEALSRGANVIDTAINYRHQRSERAVGRALERAFSDGIAARDEVFVSTKGGFLPYDGEATGDPADYLRATYLDSGLLEADEIVAGCHAMSPTYLQDQIDRSRSNLGLQTIDLYYLHNPETQLGELPPAEVATRLEAAFAHLEQAVREGAIGRYGAATWDSLRSVPAARDHLELAELVRLAGPAFAAVQLPFNLAMPEALVRSSQALEDATVPVMIAARHFDLAVFTSASILQGRLSHSLPQEIGEALPGLESDTQRALQFARSAPGVTTALVGMSRVEHVRENLAVADHAPAPTEAFQKLFGA